jgi:AsmA protein
LLQLSALGPKPIPLGDLLLRSTPPQAAARRSHGHGQTPAEPIASSFDLTPVSLPLGGKQPAVLEGRFDAYGYTLHLTGSALPARLLALGDAIPQLGDGLRPLLEPTSDSPLPTQKPSAEATDPIHLDLTATRLWGGPQTWHQTAAPPPAHPHHRSTK